MSETRRKVLAAGAAAIPEAMLGATGLALPAPEEEPCARPARERGKNSEYFPNVVLTTHEHRRVLFYDDLLAGGKTVLIHCMSIARDAVYPVVENLARVQPYLGDHLGRDVFLYSLSVDPDDTPEALRELAGRYGAGPGWLFLTGEAADVELLRGKLFAHNGPHHAGPHHGGPHHHGAKDCSVGLARYGNESIGLWGACPAKSNPVWIARRLSWVVPGRQTAGEHRRRGPHPDTYRS